MLNEVGKGKKQFQKEPAEISVDNKPAPKRKDLYKRGDTTGRLLTVLGVCCQSPGVPVVIPMGSKELTIFLKMVEKLGLDGIAVTQMANDRVSIVSNFKGVAR